MAEGHIIAHLRHFAESGVQFIVVGGVAALLNGAPVYTYDLDLVYLLSGENIDRILAILESLDAMFRVQPHRRLRPDRSHLISGGHMNLTTRIGSLDLLGTIGQGLDYAELFPHSGEIEIGNGLRVRVLDLETIVKVKEQLATEKDLAVLPVLRQTLRELQRRGGQ